MPFFSKNGQKLAEFFSSGTLIHPADPKTVLESGGHDNLNCGVPKAVAGIVGELKIILHFALNATFFGQNAKIQKFQRCVPKFSRDGRVAEDFGPLTRKPIAGFRFEIISLRHVPRGINCSRPAAPKRKTDDAFWSEPRAVLAGNGVFGSRRRGRDAFRFAQNVLFARF